MASFNLATLTISPRTLSADEFAVILPGGAIAAHNAIALDAAAGAIIRNHGTITSNEMAAVWVTGAGLLLENTGLISGGASGVSVGGGEGLDLDASIVNAGRIYATQEGFSALEIDGHNVAIVNTGEIFALRGVAIDFIDTADSAEVNTIYNAGEIFGRGTEAAVILGSETVDSIENIGRISGVIKTRADDDAVVNTGTIVGKVKLGGGNDGFDGRGGLTLGIVDGCSGDDILLGGAGDEEFLGGDGDDTLRGNGGDDTVDGGAGKDNVFGGGGDDIVRGGDLGDKLCGNGGDDSIEGGAGWDLLIGGRGDDTLNGGPGGDVFVMAPGHGFDTIEDFGDGSDTMDLQAFGLSNFADLQSTYTVRDAANGTRIDFGGGDVLLVLGVPVGQLSNDDFDF